MKKIKRLEAIGVITLNDRTADVGKKREYCSVSSVELDAQEAYIEQLEREQERLQDEIKRRERAYWGQVEAHNQAFKAFWDMGWLKFIKERHRARQYLKNDEIQELKEKKG